MEELITIAVSITQSIWACCASAGAAGSGPFWRLTGVTGPLREGDLLVPGIRIHSPRRREGDF